MTAEQDAPRVVSASREIAAGTGRIFELIADPAAQPGWDGNDNLAAAVAGERVRRAGDVLRAGATTADRLRASLDRLAALAEEPSLPS
jgi:uncharacterized protein YndB with AHSA1/START domain